MQKQIVTNAGLEVVRREEETDCNKSSDDKSKPDNKQERANRQTGLEVVKKKQSGKQTRKQEHR